GRLMGIVMEWFFDKPGLRFSFFLSGIFAIILCVILLIVVSEFQLLGIFMLLFAFESFRAWQATKGQLTDEEHDYLIQESEKAADEWMKGQQDAALARLDAISARLPEPEVIETYARYLVLANQPEKAFEKLRPFEKRLSADGARMLTRAAYESGHYKEALQIGKRAFLEYNNPEIALLNTLSAARLSDVNAAVNWLKCAQRLSNVDVEAIIASDDFASIRDNPALKKALAPVA
ncbi:MAG TPA: hypothetical protein VN457_04745, partial [Chlamydiales bacterium]|nr:hypothetical protein [Chlamydiales bacterium]